MGLARTAEHPAQISIGAATSGTEGISPRQQYNVYPFASVTQDEIDNETRYQIGADLFWRPSSNFQLNATLNPDFGNVESDDVVINLSATETFFPEKRLFFVEGQEIFVASPRADAGSSGVGNTGPPTTLVNTRRIGGSPQAPVLRTTATINERELSLPSELLGAAKATGQLGSFRYGVLTAFEDEVSFNATANGQKVRVAQDGSDYGIVRLLYENNDSGYRAIGLLNTAVQHYDRNAYVTGLDWHVLTKNGKLKMDGQVFRSDLDGIDAGYGGFVDFDTPPDRALGNVWASNISTMTSTLMILAFSLATTTVKFARRILGRPLV